VLVLLETDVSASTNGLGLLLCDSATGAHFGQIRATNNTAGVTIMADEVRSTLARFPQGIQSAVVVPDLISRDLRLDYFGLQSGLAELLRETMSREQGLAVVELEEAKSIASERCRRRLATGQLQCSRSGCLV